MRLKRSLHVKLWCWRSFRWTVVVLSPQEVSFFEHLEMGVLGEGSCMGCGRQHTVFTFSPWVPGFRGFQPLE